MDFPILAEKTLILFDLDGTLVDSASDLYRAMNLSLARLHLPSVTEAQVRVWVGKGSKVFCESVLAYLKGTVDAVLLEQLLATFLDIYNAEPCIDTQPFAGVQEFLHAMQQQGKILLCVTNKPEIPARKILQQLGLIHYFADVVGGDRFAVRKPDPKPLLFCMEKYQVQPAATLMVGDSSNDVEAARRAGVDCIVLSYGYNHGEDIRLCQPQWILDQLTELLDEATVSPS
ncbi:phosphoglycolate phosphatase [Acinetobacter larvae]|uniref:Phosphoglycolate phosphatase n=1 Tax=Acinetobacter larvae TaxID=1789224 RepID=A0A1B2M2Y3_9GAMM|nr:phosphoglycolate phosphatase [Acinetobacter larvae]AOA59539.1 phosphoglycolate phosphatase [Acinetobacter larvae]